MTEHSGGFDADLCVSTKPVIIGLSVVGTVLLFLSNTPRSIGDRHAVVPFSASLLVFSWVAWCIRERRSLTVRWLIVGVLTGAVLISSWWSQSPEVPVLLTLPAALCAALIGFPAAIAVAAEQTVVVLLHSRWLLPAPTVVAVTWLVAVWGVLGVVYMIYSPIRGVASWAWDYYRHAQRTQEEALDRQVELKQVLEDLTQSHPRQYALAVHHERYWHGAL